MNQSSFQSGAAQPARFGRVTARWHWGSGSDMDAVSDLAPPERPSLYVGVLLLATAAAFAAGAIAGLIVEPPGRMPSPWGALVGVPTILGFAIACGVLARRARTLERHARRCAKAARTDDLTELPNRRMLNHLLEVEVARALRHGYELSCLLVDLDHFKSVNDRLGHLTGDQVLVEVAARLEETIRRDDVVGRWGGEEFLIVLPHTNLLGARRVAEKVRRAIAAEPMKTSAGGWPLTASIGAAELTSLDPKRAEVLVQAADQALYEAKSAGRNRVAA